MYAYFQDMVIEYVSQIDIISVKYFLSHEEKVNFTVIIRREVLPIVPMHKAPGSSPSYEISNNQMQRQKQLQILPKTP